MGRLHAPVLALALATAISAACGGPSDPTAAARTADDSGWTAERRLDALQRARFWQPPARPLEEVTLGGDPSHAPALIECRFHVDDLGGTTPKFDCELEDGEIIRVKYGGNAEVHAEVAATRLLSALGFPADEITLVRKLRCYGCPVAPLPTMKVVDKTDTEDLYERMIDYDAAREYEWAIIERKFPAEPIETDEVEGWAFWELEALEGITAERRAHLDALRLLAVFLVHWDNKASNQRLVCPSDDPDDGTCEAPLAMVQDLGATFGPRKVDLDAWRETPIWDDRAACLVSMKTLPYDGATFGTARISEAGRRFLADRLTRLSDAQIADLFRGARFDHHAPLGRAARPVDEWVAVFKGKVRAIADGPACPR